MSAKKISPLITDKTALHTAILAVGKVYASAADQVQIILASSILQALQHGNTDPLNDLITAVGKGVRKTAIVDWALKHAPVVPETDKEKSKDKPLRFSRERIETLLPDVVDAKNVTAEEAMTWAMQAYAVHWTEYKEPPVLPQEWDVMAALKQVIQTGKTMQGKNVSIKHADILGKLADLMPQKETDLQGV